MFCADIVVLNGKDGLMRFVAAGAYDHSSPGWK
jgi:hypothetical protein